MLISPSIDRLEERIDDRSLLATLAARRAKDLLTGKKAITEEAEVNPVSQAAKEIAEGLITYKEGTGERPVAKRSAVSDSEQLKRELEEMETEKAENVSEEG